MLCVYQRHEIGIWMVDYLHVIPMDGPCDVSMRMRCALCAMNVDVI